MGLLRCAAPLAIALLLVACSRDSAEKRPQIAISVAGERCDCAVSAYRLFVLGESVGTGLPCLFFSGEATPGPIALRKLPFVSGRRYELVAFASCGAPECVACEARVAFRAQDGERAALSLQPVEACSPRTLDPASLPRCSDAASDGGTGDGGHLDAAPDDGGDASGRDTLEGDSGSADATSDAAMKPDVTPVDASPADAGNPVEIVFPLGGRNTLIVAEGVSLVRIEAWGAGGGGGEPSSSRDPGTKGGGGGYAESTIAVEVGQRLVLDVGRGGEGGGCGTDGGKPPPIELTG
jgi:hypothetical protein